MTTFPTRRLAVRVLAIAAAIVAVVLGAPQPASAHGGGGDDATNFRIDVLEPGDPGLSWRVYAGDALLELTNETGQEVIVAGYSGEPYLRFVPGDGVFENTRSPARYLNRDRYGDTAPADADAAAPPVWERVADGGSHSWHDHRAHWMSPQDPPVVSDDLGREHLIQSWTLPVTIGGADAGRQVEVAGELRWVPPVTWWPPLLIVGGVFTAVALAAILFTTPGDDRWVGLARPLVVLVWIVAAANAVRVVDDMVSVPASTSDRVVLIMAAAVGLAVIVARSVWAWRGTLPGLMALGLAGMLLLLLFASDSTSQLSASQLATELPPWVRRWTVAASFLITIPAFLAAGLGASMHARRAREQRADEPLVA